MVQLDWAQSCVVRRVSLLCDNETEASVVARDQVMLFLALMRECAACSFRLERRDKNMATLAGLGITIRDAKGRILALTVNDYVEGPTARPDRPSQESWVFGLRIHGTDVYIKLEVRLEPARCLCVSFHNAERPMAFPYRGETTRGGER